MSTLKIERLGGLAGMGGMTSHVRSHGQLQWSELSPADKESVEKLFRAGSQSDPGPTRDGFRYRLTRSSGAREETVDAHESSIPDVLINSVHDELV
jgi:hypothetical protein